MEAKKTTTEIMLSHADLFFLRDNEFDGNSKTGSYQVKPTALSGLVFRRFFPL